ncbi:MAG TPA: glycosyltransferase [Polyangia bacterium]|nr:glycosyltransferase [Polyangia bacterium]
MRVLVVTKLFPNAAEPLSAPFNRQQLGALGRRCEVEVLATIPWFPGSRLVARLGRRPSPPSRLPRADRIDGLEVTHPRTLYFPRYGHALSAGLYALSVLPALLRRRRRFDVLLGSWAYPDGVATVALGQALGLPVVVKVHGSDLDLLAQRPTLRWQLARALPRAARVVAVSRALTQVVESLGVEPSRIDVVANGVDAQLFRVRERAESRAKLGRGGDTRRWILYVGRLQADKGVLDLAAAFAKVAAADLQAALVVVGEGPERPALETMLGPLGDRACLVGALPLADVPRWMSAADLVTLPSHHEGTPNVLLEALACGRRVVATRVGGIPDIVHRPELGVLVPVGDVPALAAALAAELRIAYVGTTVAALGARGGWDESAARLEASLARAVAEGSARG